MKERLIELLNSYPCMSTAEDCFIESISDDLADYLLANGVIVLPCAAGDTVYQIEKNCLACIHYTDGGYSDWCECTLDDDKLMFECDFDKECIYDIIPKYFNYGMIESFGKTVFLSREEAVKALERSEGI